MEQLIMVPQIESFLLGSYNPADLAGGFLIAGKGEDSKWYSNSFLGGQRLFDFLCEDNSQLLKYLKENKKAMRVIPWCQYTKKEFDSNLNTFIDTSIKPLFDAMIILKPVRDPSRKDFGIEYFLKRNEVYVEAEYQVEGMEYFDKVAYNSILQLMGKWIEFGKKDSLKRHF